MNYFTPIKTVPNFNDATTWVLRDDFDYYGPDGYLATLDVKELEFTAMVEKTGYGGFAIEPGPTAALTNPTRFQFLHCKWDQTGLLGCTAFGRYEFYACD